MEIRPYLSHDRSDCLAVFDSNVPVFFDPLERADFAAFLDAPDSPYFVMEHDGAIVGCGGYAIEDEEGLASLVWGMVRRDLHKMGLGRYLLMYRLKELGKSGTIHRVRLDTSQHTAPFYEKQGFKVFEVEKDGYASGLDRMELIKKLTVCN